MKLMIRNKYSIILPVKEKKVLFNTIYGTLDLIDDSIVEKWEDKTYKWTQEESNYLSSRGHLTTLEDQELLEQKVLERESDKKDHKSKFYIVYSYICNFNCFYCFENNTKHNPLNRLRRFYLESLWPQININETAINNMHKYTALSIDECKNCALAPICGGGCYLKRVCHKTVKGEFICYKTDLEETLISLIGDMI